MTQSPLLTALLWIARHHGVDAIAQTVLNGLPVQADTLSSQYLERASHNAGLTLFRKPINETILKKQPLGELCPTSCLPCLAWLEECPVIVVHIDECSVKYHLPEQNMALQSLELDAFVQRINNELVFFSRAKIDDDRDPQYPPHWQNHWFWSAILQGRRIYREILLASLLVNFLALTIPLFVRLIYDQVIPGMALTTLNTLTIGVVIVITFELLVDNYAPALSIWRQKKPTCSCPANCLLKLWAFECRLFHRLWEPLREKFRILNPLESS